MCITSAHILVALAFTAEMRFCCSDGLPESAESTQRHWFGALQRERQPFRTANSYQPENADMPV